LPPLFEIAGLRFSYSGLSSFQLQDLRLSLEEGESVGFLGPNGAGKSTLLKVLAGLLAPTQGAVLFEGKPLVDVPLRERARKVAYLPQTVQFSFPLRVRDIVEMGRHPHLGRFRSMAKEDRIVCERSLELCDASHLSERSFEELSGGERQRVLLASALAQTPRVLLLDEPTNSLDLSHQGRLLSILRRLQAEEGLTLLCATHDLNLAAGSLGKVVLMRDGWIESQGAPSKVLTPAKVRSLYGVSVTQFKGRDGARYLFPKLAKAGRGR